MSNLDWVGSNWRNTGSARVSSQLTTTAPYRKVDFHNYVDYIDGGIPDGQGTVTCPNGAVRTGNLFGFNVMHIEGQRVLGTRPISKWSGQWYLVHYGAAAADGGKITGGHISQSTFSLTGAWTSRGDGNTGTTVCSDAPLPATFVIFGHCGNHVNVTLTASNGTTGTFPGDAICNFMHRSK